MTIRLFLKTEAGLGAELGTLTPAQFQSLVDHLEEENPRDHDYFIDEDVLDFLEEEGVDEAVIALLRPHVTEDGIDVAWRRE